MTVFVNKALLSSDTVQLNAPLFVTWVQCIVSVVICLLLGLVKRSNLPNPSDVFTENIFKTVNQIKYNAAFTMNVHIFRQNKLMFIFILGDAGSNIVYINGIDK